MLIKSISKGARQVEVIAIIPDKVYQIKDNKFKEQNNIFYLNQAQVLELFNSKVEEVINVIEI